jgi:hypothetical protein
MKEVAEALRGEVQRAAAVFRGWGEAEAVGDRGPGKWVRKEILGHLIDSAANNHQRVVRAQLVERLASPGYDQEAWVALHGYRARPWAELVDLWVSLNRHLAAVIESVPPDKLQTACAIGESQPCSLAWLITDYLRHLRHHLEQIQRG